MRLTSRTTSRRALAAVLATGLTTGLGTALATAPAGAAGQALPEPAWQSTWEALGEIDEAEIYPTDSVLDPVSGDVFALGKNNEIAEEHLLRRLDGETGATEWTVPLHASAYSQLTIDPEGGQLVLSRPVGPDRRAQLQALGLDGAPRWTSDLGSFGHVREQVTDPSTGTTCLMTVTKDAGNGDRGRRGQRWAFRCVDRAGEEVAKRSLRRSGVTEQDELGLAVDPVRGRWYVAVSRVVRERSSAVELQALDQRGRTRWRRTLAWGPRTFGSVGALTVDPVRGRVLLGTAVHGRAKKRTTLTVWNGNGRRHAARTWRAQDLDTIDEVAVSADGQHYVVGLSWLAPGATVADLRPSLRQRWSTRHTRQGDDDLDIVVDDERRRVVVAGGGVAAYRFDGSRAWGGRPTPAFFGTDLLLDRERHRVVASWIETVWPTAHVTAWQL